MSLNSITGFFGPNSPVDQGSLLPPGEAQAECIINMDHSLNTTCVLTLLSSQIPIQPAFSITAHKSHGLSLDRVVVDLESCSGLESPYVMVSRVRSLDGLMVLQPFRHSKISCALQQDV